MCGGGIPPFGCASKYWLVETAPKLRQRPLIRTTTYTGVLLNELCRCHDFFLNRSFGFYHIERTVFFIRAYVETLKRFFSCRFSGNGLRLHCRDSDGRGAAELAHCWTGYITSLVAKTVCSNVYTAPQINFSYQSTASRRVKTRIVYTGFSA